MNLQLEKLKEELDLEKVRMEEEWEELRQKQNIINDMIKVVSRSSVRQVASRGHSETPYPNS
jgi:hypothetical protein